MKTPKRGRLGQALTLNELHVLTALERGLLHKEIALECRRSVNTVTTWAKRAYAKLGVDNRHDAVRAARRFHLLPVLVQSPARLFALPRGQDQRCFYCGRDRAGAGTLVADFKVPPGRGGAAEQSNVVAACRLCRKEKGAMTAIEYVEYRSRRDAVTNMDQKGAA